MRLLSYLRSLWHQLMDLQPGHTAIVFHWDDAIRPDVVFMHRGIHQGEPLHAILDTLLEEHAGCCGRDVYTEVTIFWHQASGAWEMEELTSHYCASLRSAD